MPSTETKVGVIEGYKPSEEFDVIVETDYDGTTPKYVYVLNKQTGQFETSFYFGNPPPMCPLSKAAAIVAGSHGECTQVMFETVIENMDEVIDWDDTLNMQNGRRRRDQTDWSQRSL